jgi:hypothetical protein
MSLILFFGLSAFVVIVGVVFSALVIRHHWQQSRLAKNAEGDKA